MNDLADYFSDKDRIKELELELNEMTRKFVAARHLKNSYKLKYQELSGDKPLLRGQKALILIKELKPLNETAINIKLIAKKCFLTETYIADLWYGCK